MLTPHVWVPFIHVLLYLTCTWGHMYMYLLYHISHTMSHMYMYMLYHISHTMSHMTVHTLYTCTWFILHIHMYNVYHTWVPNFIIIHIHNHIYTCSIIIYHTQDDMCTMLGTSCTQ